MSIVKKLIDSDNYLLKEEDGEYLIEAIEKGANFVLGDLGEKDPITINIVKYRLSILIRALTAKV